MTQFFRQADNIENYKENFHVTKVRFEYQSRDREAIQQLMSGVLHANPNLETFEMVAVSAYVFMNCNDFLQNIEDIELGPAMKKLVLRDAMKYSERSNFLTKGTQNLEVLHINKTILNQPSFSLSDNLRVLKLNPLNFPTEIFEINFE